MKRYHRPLALLAAIILLLTGLVGSAQAETTASAEAKRLVVGVRADIVGFGYLNPTTGKYYGLEIDLADALAKKMGYAGAEYVTVTAGDREAKLASGEVQVLMACYTITERRKETVDFSPAYYDDYTYIIVQNSTLFSEPLDLKGLTIGAVAGANNDVSFRANMREMGLLEEEPKEPNFIFRYSNSYAELSEALEEGIIDAMCMDGSIAKGHMNDERNYFSKTLDSMQYGAATVKGSPLSAQVAEAMQALIDDGTVARLTDKWD